MNLLNKKCVPCEAGMPPLTKVEAQKYLDEVPSWELAEKDGKLRIKKDFKFDTYLGGLDFVNRVAKLAEAQGHHPNLLLGYKKVTVTLTTHVIGGLSENDFILAAKVNELVKQE